MSIQQFCLKWNNHQPNFISVFKSFLNNKSLVDVTLSAEGQQVYAHKVVLSACSIYFQALFAENPSNHPIVILKDVKYSDLQILVDFIYCGEVNVSEEQLPQILETAKTLKIKGLTEMPEASLTRSHGDGEFNADAQTQNRAPTPNSPKKKKIKVLGESNLGIAPETPRMVEHQVNVLPSTSGINIGRSEPMPYPNAQQHRRRTPQDNFHDTPTADVSQQTEEHANNQEIILQNDTINQGDWNLYNAFTSGGGLPDNVASSSNNNAGGYMMPGCGSNSGAGMDHPYGNQLAMDGANPACGIQNAPRKRRRNTNPQAEDSFQAALEAVRFGGIGFCKAARIFGVNNRTLWLEYKKRGYPNHRPSIRNRVKRENTSPIIDLIKEEMALPDTSENHMHQIQQDQAMDHSNMPDQEIGLVCTSHPLSVGFIEARGGSFTIQGVQNTQPLNLHGINYNPNQMQ